MDWVFADNATSTCDDADVMFDLKSSAVATPVRSVATPAIHLRTFEAAEGVERFTRILDIVGAATLLIVALPFLLILAVMLQLDSPGRLFFVQQRVGRGGKMFGCIKFRTMCEDADQVLIQHLANCSASRAAWSADFKLRDDPRITRLGGLVRKLSLDEFPQLLNIIRGEMSLVGPRPIIRSEIERYGPHFADYCRVRPGLTGLWQVSGRNNVSYRRRVSMDRYYARRKSVMLDVKILLKTVPAVVFARGSY